MNIKCTLSQALTEGLGESKHKQALEKPLREEDNNPHAIGGDLELKRKGISLASLNITHKEGLRALECN